MTTLIAAFTGLWNHRVVIDPMLRFVNFEGQRSSTGKVFLLSRYSNIGRVNAHGF